MTINSQSGISLLESVLSAENTRVEMGVTMLKKAQDTEKQQGEAIVNLIESAGAPAQPPALDTFA